MHALSLSFLLCHFLLATNELATSLHDHDILQRYPPLPENGAASDNEESEAVSADEARASDSLLHGVDSDEGVVQPIARPRSTESSRKRAREPEESSEPDDEEEIGGTSQATGASRDNPRDSVSPAPAASTRVLCPTPLASAPPARAKKPPVVSTSWNLVGLVDLDDEDG